MQSIISNFSIEPFIKTVLFIMYLILRLLHFNRDKWIESMHFILGRKIPILFKEKLP